MVNVLVPGLYVSAFCLLFFQKLFAHVLLLVEPHLLGQPMIAKSI